MAMAPSPLRSEVFYGPDYEALWHKLEERIAAVRQSTADSVCIENDQDKSRILRGSWGAYGYVLNMMQEIKDESRGKREDPTEE